LPFPAKYGTLSLQKLLKHEQIVNWPSNHTLKACAAVLKEQARCLFKTGLRTARQMVHPRRGADDDLEIRRPRSTTATGSTFPLCGSAKLLAPRHNAFDGSDF